MFSTSSSTTPSKTPKLKFRRKFNKHVFVGPTCIYMYMYTDIHTYMYVCMYVYAYFNQKFLSYIDPDESCHVIYPDALMPVSKIWWELEKLDPITQLGRKIMDPQKY